MPRLLDDCVKDLSGTKGIKSPWAMCINTLRKAGLIKKGKKGDWVYTTKGKARHKAKYEGRKK